MAHVDLSKLITAEDKAQEALGDRRQAVKAECRRRILEVMSQSAQMNMTAAAVADTLSPGQREVWVNGLAWVADMRERAAELASNPDADISDNRNWPRFPKRLRAVAQTF